MVGEFRVGNPHKPVDDTDTERLIPDKVENGQPERVGKCMVDPAFLLKVSRGRNLPCGERTWTAGSAAAAGKRAPAVAGVKKNSGGAGSSDTLKLHSVIHQDPHAYEGSEKESSLPAVPCGMRSRSRWMPVLAAGIYSDHSTTTLMSCYRVH
jgi:hypothetical protein